MVNVDRNHGPGALHRQIQPDRRDHSRHTQRRLDGLAARCDRRQPRLNLDIRRERGQLGGHVRARLQQPGCPLPRTRVTQDRTLSVAGFGRDDDLDPVPVADHGFPSQRQKARRIARAQVDEGTAQPGVHLDDATDAMRAQPVLRHIAVALDQKMFGIAVPEDHAPGLAGHGVEEDLDRRAHDRRQPMPDSRLTVSGSGSPITAGWLPTMRRMKAPAGPWIP